MESTLQLAERKEINLPSATDIVSLALRVWLFAICIKKQSKDIPSIHKDIPSIYMHTPYYFCIFRIKTQKHVKYAHLPVLFLRVNRDLCIQRIYMYESLYGIILHIFACFCIYGIFCIFCIFGIYGIIV